MLKCSVELRGTIELGDNYCDFITASDAFHTQVVIVKLKTSSPTGDLAAEVTIKLNHCCVSWGSSFCTLKNQQTQKFQIRYSSRGAYLWFALLAVTSGKLRTGHTHRKDGLALHFPPLCVSQRATKKRLDTSCRDPGGLSYAAALQWALPGVLEAGFDITWVTQGARAF